MALGSGRITVGGIIALLLPLAILIWIGFHAIGMSTLPQSPPLHPVDQSDQSPPVLDIPPSPLDVPAGDDSGRGEPIDRSEPIAVDTLPKRDTTLLLKTPSLEPGMLLIPVAGVRPEQLLDNYDDERSDGRVHHAIDIMAPQGTPVLAAADGQIVKLHQSEQGGITIYQRSADSTTIYYYAHLDRYVDGIAVGSVARQGETIGYVGDSGNAVPGNYHLHFAIWIITDPARYWEGTNINPYPLLRGDT